MADKLHSSLTGSELHEPKGVASATANTVYVANGTGSGSWTTLTDNSGWSSFTDTGSTQTITATSSLGTLVTNDKNASVETYDPVDLTSSLWDSTSNKFKPIALGDIYLAQLEFEIDSVASFSYGVVEIHNGSVQLSSHTFENPAGAGQNYTIPFLIPVDATTLSNGVTFNVYKDSGGATLVIDSVKMVFARLHKGS